MASSSSVPRVRDLREIKNDLLDNKNDTIIQKLQNDPSLMYCIDSDRYLSILKMIVLNPTPNEKIFEYLMQNMTHDVYLRGGESILSNDTTIMVCVKYGTLDMLRMLVKAFTNINEKNKESGHTAIQLAFSNRKNKPIETIRILLENGANPLIKDNYGRTAKEYAIESMHGDKAMIQLFEEYEARYH